MFNNRQMCTQCLWVCELQLRNSLTAQTLSARKTRFFVCIVAFRIVLSAEHSMYRRTGHTCHHLMCWQNTVHGTTTNIVTICACVGCNWTISFQIYCMRLRFKTLHTHTQWRENSFGECECTCSVWHSNDFHRPTNSFSFTHFISHSLRPIYGGITCSLSMWGC